MALTGYIKNGDKFEKIGVGVNIPVGMILPWFLNKDVPVGFIRVLDTWYDSATYPTLDAMYGDTYGRQNGKFRLPPVWDNRFLEGGSIAGELKDAGLPNIEGDSNSAFMGEGATANDGNGAFRKVTSASSVGRAWQTTTTGGFSTAVGFTFDASRYNRIYGNSDTVQPKAITVVWIIKAFEGASPSSTDIEISNLANEVVELQSKKFGEEDFTILQVNGGNNITTNSRYVLENPFPNYYVGCIVEIFTAGSWHESGWFDMQYSSDKRLLAYGVRVSQLNNTLVVQSANMAIESGTASLSGSPLTAGDSTSAPCRVKVWKVGKING